MGGQALPPLPSQRLPPAFVSIRCKDVGQKSLFWRVAGMGGSPCECLSHATYPDKEARRPQRAGDSFPVGVSLGWCVSGPWIERSAWRVAQRLRRQGLAGVS